MQPLLYRFIWSHLTLGSATCSALAYAVEAAVELGETVAYAAGGAMEYCERTCHPFWAVAEVGSMTIASIINKRLPLDFGTSMNKSSEIELFRLQIREVRQRQILQVECQNTGDPTHIGFIC